MSLLVKKASGEHEKFDTKKLRRSLRQAGVGQVLIDQILKEITKIRPQSTKSIHAHVARILKKEYPPLAARYNLKRALIDFGPAGYPFEQFVAELFSRQGYKSIVGKRVKGSCIEHEVDVVATKGREQLLIECKFHTRFGLKSDVKVPLYIKARFDDIISAMDPKGRIQKCNALIITNTRFTTQAIAYAQCVGIKLIGWSYPTNNPLPELIDKTGLHPITALTSLTKKQKHLFIKEGLVLCKHAAKHTKLFKKMGFSDKKIEKILSEAQAICVIGSRGQYKTDVKTTATEGP